MANLTDNLPQQSIQGGTDEIREAALSPVKNLKGNSSTSEGDILKEYHRHEVNMLKYGKFGKCFGSEENSSKAITFVVIVIVLFMWFTICIIAVWCPWIKFPAKEIFEVLIPLVTLAFGYFFGKK